MVKGEQVGVRHLPFPTPLRKGAPLYVVANWLGDSLKVTERNFGHLGEEGSQFVGVVFQSTG